MPDLPKTLPIADPVVSGLPTTHPKRNLTHKDALNLTKEKLLRLIDARAGLSSVRSTQTPGGKIVWSHILLHRRPHVANPSTNRLRPAYELCSVCFLIALSMPEKISA
jgi:hypothetical protein